MPFVKSQRFHIICIVMLYLLQSSNFNSSCCVCDIFSSLAYSKKFVTLFITLLPNFIILCATIDTLREGRLYLWIKTVTLLILFLRILGPSLNSNCEPEVWTCDEWKIVLMVNQNRWVWTNYYCSDWSQNGFILLMNVNLMVNQRLFWWGIRIDEFERITIVLIGVRIDE